MPDDIESEVEVSGTDPSVEDHARREFLGKAGRFAVVTPPAITLLLGTSLGSKAIAASNGTRPPHKWPKPKRKPRRRYNPKPKSKGRG